MHNEYVYDVYEVVKVVDGDTVDFILSKTTDIGYHVTSINRLPGRIRLLGVDTPERGQPGWREAGDYVRVWLEHRPNLVCVSTKSDAFGRHLGIIIDTDTDECLNEMLIETGHALPYRS